MRREIKSEIAILKASLGDTSNKLESVSSITQKLTAYIAKNNHVTSD